MRITRSLEALTVPFHLADASALDKAALNRALYFLLTVFETILLKLNLPDS